MNSAGTIEHSDPPPLAMQRAAPVRGAWLLAGFVCASMSACYQGGEFAGDGTATTGTTSSVMSTGSAEETTDSGEGPSNTPASGPTGLRLLTPSQYQNSVIDALGTAVVPAVGQWRSSIAAAQGGVAAATVETYEEAAMTVTADLFAGEEARLAFTGCTPSSVADDPCVTEVVARVGRRAWRRSLTADELDRYTALAADVAGLLEGDAWAGLQHAIAGLLQSPNFLYRVELGTPVSDDDPLYVRLNDDELASRLSYLIWNTSPDDALLDAVELGELSDADGLKAQVDRLLDSPRARAGIVQLFVDMFDLDTLLSLQKDPMLLPAFTPTLGPAMYEELVRVLEDTLLVQRDYRRLFDTQGGFVDAELAAHYGIEGAFDASFVPVTLPETRGGILTLAGFLAINSGEASTSPTKRGLTVREVLMCQLSPPPPPDVVPELPEPGEDEPKTKRELLEAHVSDPACAACHAFSDPIGLGLEHYDALGGYRETDQGLPIDPSGELNGQPFANAVELGSLFTEDPAVADCVVRNLYRYATGHIEQTEEQATIAALREGLKESGYDLTAAVEVLARSEAYRFATLSSEDLP